MTKRTLFYVVVLLQVMLLLVMSASFYAIDWFGKEIRLKTEPVDPRDIFYGDYVVLQYSISTIPKKLYIDSEELAYEQQVYVVLEQEGEYYQAITVSTKEPELEDHQVTLKGRYIYDFDEDELFIEYGLERYFIPEGTGKELEEQRGNMEAYIKIAPWGQMKIDRLEMITP
ncbi:putative membrane-anchored protein [Bacillus mesophilus]|uniref:GDYXXLXY domain-containing protein n=1 Tax=Bacillus mesophilus TaxID=1808955 RepID=A0A6M0Q2W1_9BACI|nr:GDYXXLXY domain-containing protein [Bacillus mesophilus]MBM7659808.1 putative membrane-anchored protein [Bacillus mesophilus]NEY70667.1 GDYXXLXY domain-containing protein [Bacillus mesophilus]